MLTSRDRIIFALFLSSGFCSLLYQVVWVRMAYASFGVITPVLSVVISVFMLGLSIGSWGGGKWIEASKGGRSLSAVHFYAAAELLIGVGAFVVPLLFALGEHYLLPVGEMDSFRYLLFSALIITLAILPWCILMGFTFPFMMEFIREVETDRATSFSYLYFANVIGAMCGTMSGGR